MLEDASAPWPERVAVNVQWVFSAGQIKQAANTGGLWV